MMLSRDNDKRKDMGMEGQILKGWVYKRKKPLYQPNKHKKNENREPTKEEPQINSPYP